MASSLPQAAGLTLLADTVSLIAESNSSIPDISVEADRIDSHRAPAKNRQTRPHQAVGAEELPRLPQLQNCLTCFVALLRIESFGMTA